MEEKQINPKVVMINNRFLKLFGEYKPFMASSSYPTIQLIDLDDVVCVGYGNQYETYGINILLKGGKPLSISEYFNYHDFEKLWIEYKEGKGK